LRNAVASAAQGLVVGVVVSVVGSFAYCQPPQFLGER
jgi:hypothetical protein